VKKSFQIEVFAPASSANLGSGFDVFGLAVEGPGDYIRMQRNGLNELRIRSITGDGGKLSRNPEENTAGVALLAYLNAVNAGYGFDLWINKKLPLGSGLGSSAASAVAAVFAANELLGRPMQKRELIRWAAEGERVASGAVHADNIAPSMLGGITLVRSVAQEDILSLPVPKGIHLVIVHPHVEVRTSDARKVLPSSIPLKTAIRQWSNTASLVAACYTSDLTLFGKSMEDEVAEPARKALIPYYDEAKSVAFAAGAVGCSISGAGPSILAVCDALDVAKATGVRFKKIYKEAGLGCAIMVTKVDRQGARIIKK
jgi:homoserine kinase